MKRWLVGGGVVIAIVVGLWALLAWYGQTRNGGEQTGPRGRRGGLDPAPLVLVMPPRVQDVPVLLDAVGTVTPLRTVTIRAQVEGRLLRVAFREGQMVKEGELLAEIDPTLYQAQLDQALAKKAQDEAQLANARLDLKRYDQLANDKAASKQQADTQRALVAQLEALVKLDQASIDNSRAVLGYTRVVSPISGRVGIRQVDEGNIVRASDPNGLVVVTQINPISVLFSMPQQQLPSLAAAMARGRPRVDILRPDGGEVLDTGILEVIDNQIDQNTGTIRMKAVFPNDAARLWPGQYVALRVLVDVLTQRTVIPVEALQRGPSGPFVYVVAEGNKAMIRPVKVEREGDGLAVVEGVTAQDRVVTNGFSRLVDGADIRIATTDGSGAAPPSLPAGARQRGSGGEGRRERPAGSAPAEGGGSANRPPRPAAP